MKTKLTWLDATKVWQAILLLMCCTCFTQVQAQTGVYAYGRSNTNEGGRVLIDNRLDQHIFIGGYREDSILILEVDYNGSIISETCFKLDPNATFEMLTDFKYNALGTELVATGIFLDANQIPIGGFAFQMFPAGLGLGWVTQFDVVGGTVFLPYSVQDPNAANQDYRMIGTNYPALNCAFVLVDRTLGTEVPGSMVDYNLTNAEGYDASTIGPNNNIYAVGRFAHSASPGDYRPGIVDMNDNTGILNFQETYMRPVGTNFTARLYPRDVILATLPGVNVEVTVGQGDMQGASAIPRAFWSAHIPNLTQVAGGEIRFNEFDHEGAREVIQDINGPSLQNFLIYGQGTLLPPANTDQLWVMSLNAAGTVNWAHQYGGTGMDYFSAPGLEAQQQLIPISAGTATMAFTATTTSYGAGGEDILLVLTNALGTFDAVDDTCIVDTLNAVLKPYSADSLIGMKLSQPNPTDTQLFPPVNDPNMQRDIVCGTDCFAALDPDYTKILSATTFDIFTSPTGTETWSGKYYIGADITIDGIVLDVTQTDVVFDHCTGITLINGARLRANNSTFRPCSEDDSWEGISFTATGQGIASGVVNECVFKNAVEALRFTSGGLPSAAIFDARITNNLFVNCWSGVSIPTSSAIIFQEGITGNTFTVDDRPITWRLDNPSGVCSTFVPTDYFGIRAMNTTFNAQISQNDFINTNDVSPAISFVGITLARSSGRISLNNFTDNRLAIQLNKCNSTSIENNRAELTQLFTPFNTQILAVTSSYIWVTGNHIVNSTEDSIYNRFGAAISMEFCYFTNVKENQVDGFTNGIQLYRSDYSTINENKLTNCNLDAIVVDGGFEDTVSCNEIKMRLRPYDSPMTTGIFYWNIMAIDPTVHIKSNCITDATVGILASNNFFGVPYRVPRMHNNYLYNYTRWGVLSQNFNGAQGSGIGSPSAAARNTFASNNATSVDVETGGLPQVWYGNDGIATVSLGVTLVGNGIYHSIASCGLQIEPGYSTIDIVDICDVYMSNIDGSYLRVKQGDYSEFADPKLTLGRGELARTMVEKLIQAGDMSIADNFKSWIMSSEKFSPFEKAWVDYHYQLYKGDNALALLALDRLAGFDVNYGDFVAIERIHLNLKQSGRDYSAMTVAELDILTAIDAARGRFSDDARDMMHDGLGRHPHIFKEVPQIDLDDLSGRSRDVSMESIHLFPNPANTQVTVEYVLENATGATLRVYDATGRLMLQNALVGDVSSTRIDISTWAPGIYMVSIFNAEGKARTVKLQVK